MPRGDVVGASEPATACLVRALRAETALERQRHALQGLARPDAEEPDTRALLLRQLHLAHLELGELDEALRVAEEVVELEELGDVARQDAARVALALGEIDAAVGHLRIAARICPADRRAFHYSTLGAVLRFADRHEDAVLALQKGLRWATRDRALLQAQLALVQLDAGQTPSSSLESLRDALENAPQKPYALWILGELCALQGDAQASSDYLQRFLERFDDAPQAKLLSLAGEIAHARSLLRKLPA